MFVIPVSNKLINNNFSKGFESDSNSLILLALQTDVENVWYLDYVI